MSVGSRLTRRSRRARHRGVRLRELVAVLLRQLARSVKNLLLFSALVVSATAAVVAFFGNEYTLAILFCLLTLLLCVELWAGGVA